MALKIGQETSVSLPAAPIASQPKDPRYPAIIQRTLVPAEKTDISMSSRQIVPFTPPTLNAVKEKTSLSSQPSIKSGRITLKTVSTAFALSILYLITACFAIILALPIYLKNIHNTQKEKETDLVLPLPCNIPVPEDFRSYVKKHCPGHSPEQAWRLAQLGKQLEADIQGLGPVTLKLKYPPKIRKKYLAAFLWHLMHKAIEKGQGFSSGTFLLKDPNYKICQFFRDTSKVYTRLSTHFQERIIPSKFVNDSGKREKGKLQYGIDITQTNSGLPADKNTILFAPVKVPDGSHYTFFKPEDHGAKLGTVAWFFHFMDLLKSYWPFKSEENVQREKTSPEIVATFEKLCAQINRPAKLGGYGIAAMISHLLPYSKDNPAIQSFITKLQDRYDHLPLRKGDEVILAE